MNIEDTKNPNTSYIQRVETVTIRENITGQCNKRNDKWGLQIKACFGAQRTTKLSF